MDTLHRVLTWANIIGVPALFTITAWFGKKVILFGRQMKILMNAQQKQMRRELTMDFHMYMERGYIKDDELDLWEAGYQAYHELGQNGIMDNRRNKLIELNASGKKAKK